MPQSLAGGFRLETGASVLDTEIVRQKAETLGDLGRQVEDVLADLKAIDPGDEALAHRRETLLDDAADRVWSLMIQRELCGMRHWEAVVRSYGIPREVLNRMGRVRR